MEEFLDGRVCKYKHSDAEYLKYLKTVVVSYNKYYDLEELFVMGKDTFLILPYRG